MRRITPGMRGFHGGAQCCVRPWEPCTECMGDELDIPDDERERLEAERDGELEDAGREEME